MIESYTVQIAPFRPVSNISRRRLTRSLIASKFKENGADASGAQTSQAKRRDEPSKSRKKQSKAPGIDELYASPQKMVVRVHGLEGADPRMLSMDGYVK